jgi:hypothetical protein
VNASNSWRDASEAHSGSHPETAVCPRIGGEQKEDGLPIGPADLPEEFPAPLGNIPSRAESSIHSFARAMASDIRIVAAGRRHLTGPSSQGTGTGSRVKIQRGTTPKVRGIHFA